MVSAVILAAGASSRMGSPKALLTIRGETFLQRIVHTLHAARVLDIVLVLGAQEEIVRPELSWFEGTIVINPGWQHGQLSSVIRGIDALSSREDHHGTMIVPVDHPLVTPHTLVALLHEFWKSKNPIVIPTHTGKRGHPIIIRTEVFHEVRTAPPETGLRHVVRMHDQTITEVDVPDAGVITNIDTPEAFASLLQETAS